MVLERPLDVAQDLARTFAATAAERDAAGGTPLPERNLVRESGLLSLLTPSVYGGAGADWPTALRVVRVIAAADPSLAHVLGYHFLGAATPHLFGSPEQRDQAYEETARDQLWWGNAINPLDTRTTLSVGGNGWRLSGAKSFCSGSAGSDRLVVSASQPGSPRVAVMVVPTRRDGVDVLNDWDNMGQRQTDSGSVRFDAVRIKPHEVLGPPGPGGSPFATLRTCLTQLILANVYTGIALGAIAEASPYTREQARAWPGSGVEHPGRDPYVLRTYGELWVAAQAAEALADRAAEQVQAAWRQAEALTAEQRGQAAVAVSTAKVAAANAGLAAAQRMFEVMGSRATAAHYRFDRFWRNVRTLTLHDPLEYKLREVGDYALNGALPTPGFYS